MFAKRPVGLAILHNSAASCGKTRRDSILSGKDLGAVTWAKAPGGSSKTTDGNPFCEHELPPGAFAF